MKQWVGILLSLFLMHGCAGAPEPRASQVKTPEQVKADKIAGLYDERFCRMWDLYLTICEMGFRYENLMVFQIQLSKNLEVVPLTRDYMFDWERMQRAKEKRSSNSNPL
mgnify:CR=1 FL=1